MGCAASSIDKEEMVLVCKERKKLMKQLVRLRGDFADAQLAYLRALRNTGVTLRQFTESESLELENTSYVLALPPSPPPTLPPSPPPPPPFSPDLKKPEIDQSKEVVDEEEDGNEVDDSYSGPTPPPPVPSSSWSYRDLFEPLGASNDSHGGEIKPKGKETVGQDEEEDWAETKMEFDEEEDAKKEQKLKIQLLEEDSSVIEHKIRRTLERIIRELDDYFLKASACEKEIAVIIDIGTMDSTMDPSKETKRKTSNSAKVFSALSRGWSSKSLQLATEAMDSCSIEPCKPGAHCTTLEKLYTAEKKLHELVRNKEIAKLELARKSVLRQKLDQENYDNVKREKTRISIESLEAEIKSLEGSITAKCSYLLKLIEEQLYPQLVALTSGLLHMWMMMQKCHEVQIRISKQLNDLSDYPSMDLSSEYKRKAAVQLENEVTCWYNSFCKLMNYQREYVETLCKWIQRTDRLLLEDNQRSNMLTAACKLCEEWKLVFEKLPHKVASESINSFLLSIKSIIQQQAEEYNLKKKCGKLERKLEKELSLLIETERRLEGSTLATEDSSNSMALSSKHPLLIKQKKIEALRKRMDVEKEKYSNAVEVSKRMALNNLKSSVPNVFQALTDLASAFSNGFEAVHGNIEADVYDTCRDHDESQPEGTSDEA